MRLSTLYKIHAVKFMQYINNNFIHNPLTLSMQWRGEVDRKRSKGRPKATWQDNIKDWTRLTIHTTVQCAKIAAPRDVQPPTL